MEVFLQGLLPRVLPPAYSVNSNCFIRPHQGKQDLIRSLSKKVKVFPHYGIPLKVLVIHDQDSNDCKTLKEQIVNLFNNTPTNFLVRIACRELENWYLGDLVSLGLLDPQFDPDKYISKSKFRDPDRLNGYDELQQLISFPGKIHAARIMGQNIDIHNNRSASFNQLLNGIQRLTT